MLLVALRFFQGYIGGKRVREYWLKITLTAAIFVAQQRQ